VFDCDGIWEISAELIFDIRPSAHFLGTINEFFVPQHIRELLPEESNFVVNREMSVLVLRQLPVQLVLLLD
jgi:hypothetical protein